MLRLTIILLTAPILLWSLPAVAASWEDCVSGTANGTIQSGISRCVDFVTGDLDSAILNVGDCENFDVIYNADDTGTETTMTIQVRTCVTNACNANACNPIENITLTGAAGSAEMYGAAGTFICIDGTTDPSATTPRVLLHCNR